MTTTRSALFPITAAALLVLACAESNAGRAPAMRSLPHTSALMQAQAGDVGSAAAAAAARQATGGQVLGVVARRAGERVLYQVKVLLPGGRVRSVTVDGASGTVQR